MGLNLVIPPTNEPIDLLATKNYLRVDTTDDDSLITVLITAAREYCEGFLNRSLLTQTWELWLDAWPEGSEIRIPRPPLQSVTSVKYYGTDNTEYTLPLTDYFVDAKSEPGRLVLAYGKTWPSITLRPANAVCVEFVAGYGDDAGKVPQKVKQAMYLLIGHWYENREAVRAAMQRRETLLIPFGVDALLWQERVVPV